MKRGGGDVILWIYQKGNWTFWSLSDTKDDTSLFMSVIAQSLFVYRLLYDMWHSAGAVNSHYLHSVDTFWGADSCCELQLIWLSASHEAKRREKVSADDHRLTSGLFFLACYSTWLALRLSLRCIAWAFSASSSVGMHFSLLIQHVTPADFSLLKLKASWEAETPERCLTSLLMTWWWPGNFHDCIFIT